MIGSGGIRALEGKSELLLSWKGLISEVWNPCLYPPWQDGFDGYGYADAQGLCLASLSLLFLFSILKTRARARDNLTSLSFLFSFFSYYLF